MFYSYGSLNSVNFLEGLPKGPQWPLYSNLNTQESLQNYLKRLAAVPAQVNIVALFCARLHKRFSPPRHLSEMSCVTPDIEKRV